MKLLALLSSRRRWSFECSKDSHRPLTTKWKPSQAKEKAVGCCNGLHVKQVTSAVHTFLSGLMNSSVTVIVKQMVIKEVITAKKLFLIIKCRQHLNHRYTLITGLYDRQVGACLRICCTLAMVASLFVITHKFQENEENNIRCSSCFQYH